MELRMLIFVSLVVLAVLTKLFWRRAYIFAKPLPVIFIIVNAFASTTRIETYWFAAISFGLAGDILLLHPRGFVAGLLSFLFGHIFYIFAFNREGGGWYQDIPISLAIFLGVLLLVYYLVRHLVKTRQKKYILPVFVYTVVSGLFLLSSMHNPIQSAAVIGAFFFCFSDFLLGFHKFVRPIWYVQAAVSITYYMAQWLLALHFGYIR
ncbi:MAG: hypothetical protein LDLANPLL_02299 [Turneriella sp.]|nr:hypothetical protein [Turneriella sp.]